MESVPGVFVSASPCARFPNSFPNALAQVVAVRGSAMRFLYFVIVSPVIGCVTGAQKWHGELVACDGGGAAIVARAV